MIIFPNTTINVIHFNNEVSSVKIMDMMGNVLEYLQKATKCIDLSKYAEGTYIVIAQTKDRAFVHRIVKSK